MTNSYTVAFPNLKGGFDDIVIKAKSIDEFKAIFTEMNRKQNADIISGKLVQQVPAVQSVPVENKAPITSLSDITTVDQRLKILEDKMDALTELIIKLVKK